MTEELPPPFSTPMPEDRRGRLELFKERARAYEVLVNQRQAAAEARGRQLLLSLLDDGQRGDLEANGSFQTVGSEGGLFRIGIDGMSGNVVLVEPPRPPLLRPTELVSFCAHYQALPDPFLYPYIRTLQPDGVEYCCPGCDGKSYEAWLRDLHEGALEAPWPEARVERKSLRYLCQSDLMIGQMFKIQVDEVGWCDVAVPCARDYEKGQKYLEKINAIRIQRKIEETVGMKVSEFGVQGAIAAGPLTIRIRDPYDGDTAVRTVRVTDDGGWVITEPVPHRPWDVPADNVVVAPWARMAQAEIRINVDAQLAAEDLGAAAAILNAQQRVLLQDLTGDRPFLRRPGRGGW